MKKLDYEIITYKSHMHNDENLSGFIVGFLVTDKQTDTQNVFEAIVPFSEVVNKTEQQIAQLAYKQLKHSIKSWAKNLPDNNIVGSKFVPVDDEDDE